MTFNRSTPNTPPPYKTCRRKHDEAVQQLVKEGKERERQLVTQLAEADRQGRTTELHSITQHNTNSTPNAPPSTSLHTQHSTLQTQHTTLTSRSQQLHLTNSQRHNRSITKSIEKRTAPTDSSKSAMPHSTTRAY